MQHINQLQAKLFLTSILFAFTLAMQAQSGIFESYAIINTGGSDLYYDLQATSPNPNFDGANLGTFSQCTGTLRLDGGQNKTFKCPGDDITNGTIWYRVYPTGSPSGSFTSVNLPFAASLGSGCGGNDQQWESNTANISLLANRTPGNYTLEVYTTANFTFTGGGGGSGTHFANNGGANYSATFTVTGGATCPVFVTASGGTTFASYSTLKGAFDAVNAGTHTGTITIDIAASTTETASAVLNSSGAGSASYTSILIRPTADGISVSGPSATGRGLIEFNGADNVTLDGDNPNSSGINRNLTITNTAANTITYTMAVRIAVATSVVTSANDIVIKNCNVNGSGTGRNISIANASTGTENTTYGIYAGGGASTVSQTNAPSAIGATTTTAGSGGTMSGLTISNNTVNACARGIAVQGSATSVINTLTVTNNVVGPAASGSTTSVYAAGITLQGFAAAQVSGNTIQNMESYLAQTIWALDFGSVSSSGTNAVVEKNTIQKVNLQNTGTYGVYGINLNAGNNFTVRNNMISDLQSNMTGGAAFSTGFGIFGIRINSGTGHAVYHNSVHLFGLRAGMANTSLLSAALGLINTAQTGCDIRNNILSNTISGGTTSIANVSIYLPSGASSSLNLILNNNAYYSGTDAARQGIAQAGVTAGSGFYLASNFNASSTSPAANLRAYTSTLRTGGANDNASFATTTTVPYTSATDLHIPAATSTLLESGGAAVGVTTDIDGDARPNGLAPDMGADEFVGVNPSACTGTPTAGTISSVPASICASGSAVLTLTGATSGIGISYQWREATTPGGPYTNVGTNSTTYNTGSISATRYYVVDVTCSNGPSTSTTAEFTMTVNSLPTVLVSPASGLICNPGGTAVSLTASGASTYTWAPATGLNMTTGATVSANPSATTTYTVTGTDGNGCQSTAMVTVTVGNKPAISSATATPASVCTGSNSQLNVVAGESVNTVSGGGITINSAGNATTYPSTIAVSGVPGTITNLKVTVTNLTHTFPVDIDMVLFGPTGAHSIIFTDAIGGSGGITNRTYTFQVGAPVLPTSGFPASGTYGVTGSSYNGSGTPSAVTNTGLGVFNSTNPNGTWSLYVFDDATGDAGSIGSWSLEITTGAPVATYSWSPATFLNNAAIANPLASNVTAQTTYTVTATAPSGCFSTADVTVNVNPVPTATVSGGGTVCSTDPLPEVSFALTGTGPWNLTYNDGTNNVPVMGINASPYVITNAPAGTYTVVSVSDANCTGTGSGSTTVAVTTATAWYQDSDGDTYGNPSVSQMACTQPSGYVADNTDCDDNIMAVNPGATEVCNGVDDDCDGPFDEGVQTTFYEDVDMDGFGDPNSLAMDCTPPPGYVINDTDCDDTNADLNPNTVWYLDADNDNYYTGSGMTQCVSPGPGYKYTGLLGGNDCNDGNAAINSGATEICNDGIDNNCDTQIDENCSSCPATGTIWYVDAAAASGGNGASWTCAFQQIQTAINAAVNGDQILVAAGTYVENLFVNKSLTITGVDGRDLTFVHAATATYTLHVDGNAGAPVLSGNVTIEGFTFADPQRLHWCIVATDHIATGLQLTFRNNRITDGNRYGFWDYHSHGILLCENNIFSDVYYGMLLEGWDTGMVTIQNNEFTNLHFYLDQNGVANPAFGGPVGILSMTYSSDGGVDCTNPYRIFENHFHTYFNDGLGIVFNGGLTGLGAAKYTDVEISRNTIAPGATGTGIRLRNLPAPNNSPNGGVHNAGIYNNFISNVLFGIRLQGDNPGTEATQNSLVNCSTDAIENTGTALMEASCNWYGSAAAANVAPQISGNVNYQSWLVNGTDDDLVTLGFQPVSGSCTGCAQPVLQTTINTVVVTNNNNGTDDTGSFSVCNGEDVVFDNFQDISGLGLTGLKVYQTATYTNLSPTFCNNCAALLSTYTGTMETATLVNPAISGTLVLRFRAWADADGNNMVDPEECSGDWIQYTITVLPSQLWYADADGDGFGDPASTTQACSQPVGYIADNTDCDDNNDEINPAATEACDGIDNDCDTQIDEGITFTTYYTDADGDGYGTGAGQSLCANPGPGFATQDGDCDDNNDEINPAATEICDGIDNDCDTQIDEGITFTTYYTDADGDGYGTGVGQSLCANPGAGFATQAGDCDDNNDEINPAATEACDGIDNDCDTQIDEGITFTTYYTDADGDGYGTGAGQSLCANPGPGFATQAGDCNDNNDEINPAATEICDGLDNDCNSMTDEGVQLTFYEDVDGDGYGDPNSFTMDCTAPIGYVSNDDDCNDNADDINPGENESCDGIDNNCSGAIDEGLTFITYYPDGDGDGYGITNLGQSLCANPGAGYTTLPGDCHDGNDAINPGETESCDGLDNNCSGAIDEGLTFITYYPDGDGDGYGITNLGQSLCANPGAGYTTLPGDCHDGNDAINPGEAESCDGIDNNCSGAIDEGLTFITYYPDGDGDGYGITGLGQSLCANPGAGYATLPGDCHDGNDAINPGESEICDGLDNNCSGAIDEGLTFTTYYTDADGDGYGTGLGQSLCANPGAGFATQAGDCNDNNDAINPGEAEACDGIDNNCSGTIDEGLTFTTYYTDADGDGYGTGVGQSLCANPGAGFATQAGDCNDNNDAINPGEAEACDGIDNNCSGTIDEGLTFTTYYTDADGDGYGTGVGQSLCANPGAGFATQAGDCNDNNDAINPGEAEACDGIDNNCDAQIDNGVLITYYRDMDGDGFGNPSNTTMACSLPSGYVANNTDCNDNSALEKPGQTWYADADNDNYSTGIFLVQCLRPVGFKAASELIATIGDCNDSNAAINPAATEVCDGIDNNCNGSTDEGVQTTYYRDMDGDGFGNPSNTTMACSLPSGYVVNNTDCNDNSAVEKPGQIWYKDTDNDGYAQTGAVTLTQCLRPSGYKVAGELIATTGDCNDNNANINPAAAEICDGMDNDCDGQTDEGVKTPYFADTDGDGFGDPNNMITECSQPQGYVANNTDCNDTDNTVNPSEEEVCDNKDNDCNGIIDDIGGATTGTWTSGDVGGANGSANFPPCNAEPTDVFTINATGFSTSSSDKLHAVYQELCGNGEIIARVLNVQNGGWAGIMLRETLDPGSKKVSLKTQLTPTIRREIRSTTNGAVSILNFNRPQHVWLRLTRNGSNFVGYTSTDGANWSFAFSATISMNGCIYAGLFAESINNNVTTTATFDHVTIIGTTPMLGATTQPASALDRLTVSVYPNPTSGEMTLSVTGAPDRNLQLEVTDMMGRIVRNIELPEGAVFNYPLDLSSEPAGVYFLRLRSENGVENVQRVVVQQ